ncbi:MAG: hypothetical protein HY243_13330 [Proteobacteria bacterium]|nr:hypothetical protein [Pseudomonadota bacterium]
MTYLAVALSLVALVIGLKLSRAVEVAKRALVSSREGLAVLSDRSLSDSEKERLARRTSLALFAAGGHAALRLILALVFPAVLLGLAVITKLVEPDALFAVLGSWPVMLAGLLAFALAVILER